MTVLAKGLDAVSVFVAVQVVPIHSSNVSAETWADDEDEPK